VASLTCTICGFDGDRWSDDDVERTLAHTDDLIGYVLEGADALLPTDAQGTLVAAGADPLASTHAVMHRLHEVAELRRTRAEFQPMVGRVDSLQASGGGVPKASILSAEIGPSGIVGDIQGNRRHHGRPWQALCLYSSDVLAALQGEGHPIVAGGAGENITVSGVDWSRMRGGLTIEIGSLRLVTTSPAAPCHKIGECFTDREWTRIDHAGRPGWARWYASVVTGGTIAPGDQLTVRT